MIKKYSKHSFRERTECEDECCKLNEKYDKRIIDCEKKSQDNCSTKFSKELDKDIYRLEQTVFLRNGCEPGSCFNLIDKKIINDFILMCLSVSIHSFLFYLNNF